MDNKEAIAALKSNYPHGRVMLSEAVDLSIKTLEAAESQTTAARQLKAEIAALANRLENDCDGLDAWAVVRAVSQRMRQLSAI